MKKKRMGRYDIMRTYRIMVELTEAEKGVPPTLRVLMDEVGISSPSVALSHMRRLEEQGLVERVGDRPTYRVVAGEWRLVEAKTGA